MTKKTVFISSTIEDLKEYRKTAWNVLEKYDVDVTGMEKFGARSENSLNVCLAEVEQSDIYVGIIGCRLGSIDEETGKSITQLEYEKAKELGKEIYIYIIDEAEAAIAPVFVDKGYEYSRLNAFKEKLKRNYTVDKFKDKDNFGEKLKVLFDKKLSKKDKFGKPKDEYQYAKQLISNFLLLPGTYSGKLIKLTVKFIGEPFSASKSVCQRFNYRYGDTLGTEIEIIKPDVQDYSFKELFMDSKMAEKFLTFDRSKTCEIYAIMEFSEEKVTSMKACFQTKSYFPVTMTLSSCEPIIKSDGTIILSLHSIE